MKTVILNFNGHDQPECQCGATFDNIFSLSATDLSLVGYSAKMQVKKNYNSILIVELSTTNGKIVIDTLNNRLQLKLSASETAALTPGKYLYDLKLIKDSDSTAVRLFSGEFVISPGVTV